MGDNRPTRHHYVPRMLLKNFCDDGGLLWAGDRKEKKCYRANPINVCVVGNLYKSYDYSQKTDSYEFEHSLSRIESKAGPAISSIIEQVRRGDNPRLDPERNKHFKEFVIALARRTPESQERVSSNSDKDFDDVVDSVMTESLTQGGYDVPEKDWFDRNPDVLELKRKIKSNINARFAAGEHHILQQESERFSRETGWGVAIICIPKKEEFCHWKPWSHYYRTRWANRGKLASHCSRCGYPDHGFSRPRIQTLP